MKKIALQFILLLCLSTSSLYSQVEPDDIALASDDFQEVFYDALMQKGIENYDKAIIALEKCLNLQPNNATIYFELGKNYLAQKDYKKAYDSFERATQLDSKNMWFLVGMYDVCYETRDFDQAIEIVKKLIPFKKEYKEDLTSLYMNTQQFDKALTLINELNDNVGKTEMRDNYKASILRNPKYQDAEIVHLEELIVKEPKVEANYISLIFLYSEGNQEEKALKIAKKLEKEIPTSDWAQVSLFKFHLANNDGQKAIKAMNSVLASKKIDNKIRHRVLNEFLIFAKDKPQFDGDLQKAIAYFDNDPEVDVAKEIGKFFHNKKDWAKAEKYYNLHLQSNSDDLETVILLYQIYGEQQQFLILAQKSEAMIESYPLQPDLYFYAGLANNQLKNFKKAKDLLEMGLDYIVDNRELEMNFNIQLGEAYSGLGDKKQMEKHFQKADQILKKGK